MWIIDLLQLTKEHLSFLNNQEQDVFLPPELSVETLDLSLPLNWSVWLIIWYFRIPYKSPPYFGDYNFKKRHLIYRRHQGGWGRRRGRKGEGKARRYSRDKRLSEDRIGDKRLSEDTIGNICLIHHPPLSLQTAALEYAYIWEIFIIQTLADR